MMRKFECKIKAEEAHTLLKKNFLLKKKYPQKKEALYLEFYLFKVEVDPGNDTTGHEYVLVDVDTGAFSFFEYDEKELPIEENSSHTLQISMDEALAIVKREYNYHLLHRNLRIKLPSKITRVTFVDIIQYPFWVGYFVHSNHFSVEAIDGLNGQKQSGRIKKLIVSTLSNTTADQNGVIHKPVDTAHSLSKSNINAQ